MQAIKFSRLKISCMVLVVAIALLAIQGCVSARTAHLRTLQSCHTRDDVSRHFGLPAEEVRGQTTEWIYNLASRHDSITGMVFIKVADSAHAAKELKYHKYLKFTFDAQGNVIGYTSNVDDPVKAYINKGYNITVLGIVGAALFLGLVVYITAHTGNEPSF